MTSEKKPKNRDFEEGMYKGCMYHSLYTIINCISHLEEDNERLRDMGIELFTKEELKSFEESLSKILKDKMEKLQNDGDAETKSSDEYRIVEDEEPEKSKIDIFVVRRRKE